MESPGRTGGIRVLVADDEPTLLKLFEAALTAAGCRVTTVGDGNAAAAVVEREAFDVILADIQMPGMSGLDLLRIVRTRDLDVPVILMTGWPDVESATDAVELGALRYLVKPISIDVLCEAVERAARLHELATMKRHALALSGGSAALAADKAGLMASFDRALPALTLAFQAIVCPQRRTVFAYEALLRSPEPLLPNPMALLEAGERLDRLHDLGRRVRQLAARAVDHLPAEPLLFVNLHPRDLLDEELLSSKAPLSRRADRVVLEITERAALDGIDDVPGRVARLRELGYRIALDDLGAGYSGLNSFALLEPEFVKLDRSLVVGCSTSDVRRRLIASMTGLCTELGFQVIAEGVETQEDGDTLASLGCSLLQGSLYSNPGPSPATSPWS